MMSFWVVPASWAATSSGDEVGVLLLGDHLVHREHPHRDRVDRHRGVHLGERDVLEEPPHLAQVRHGHADLADLAARERGVGVVAGLGRQVEGDRQAGLALRQVGAVERVGRRGRRVPGVRAHQPWAVLLGHGPRVGRVLPRSNRHRVWVIRHDQRGRRLDLDDPDQVGQVQHPAYGGTAAAQREVVTGAAAPSGWRRRAPGARSCRWSRPRSGRRRRPRRGPRGGRRWRCGPPTCCARRSRR